MVLEPHIFDATVMHHRHQPKPHGFTYSSSYMSLPISKGGTAYPKDMLAINKLALLSFYEKDHGDRDGSDLYDWVHAILKKEGLEKVTKHISLITLPRIFGYVFNPVSFWLCLDENKNIRALISEVNNTFGDTHTYLCANHDHQPIEPDQWLTSRKLLYVSPFIKREGGYKFRISLQKNKLAVWVNHFTDGDDLLLSTSLIGELKPFSKNALRLTFLKFPFTAVKTITLIHWQALKLWLKGIKYVSRPAHGKPSTSTHLEKRDQMHHESKDTKKAAKESL